MAPLDPEPGNNTTDISDKGRFVEPSADEILLWAVVCALVTFFGLGLATFKYLRDQYDTPDNKKKRKDKSELERRGKGWILTVNADPVFDHAPPAVI
uniref:Uncharacterized protein n=1 Tax=Magallana gigas TaxID=29159 RepID=K1RKN0_MAGGI